MSSNLDPRSQGLSIDDSIVLTMFYGLLRTIWTLIRAIFCVEFAAAEDLAIYGGYKGRRLSELRGFAAFIAGLSILAHILAAIYGVYLLIGYYGGPEAAQQALDIGWMVLSTIALIFILVLRLIYLDSVE